MIVDIHTHIFPPDLVADRERLLAHDATFASMYANPRAVMATAEDLLDSMLAAGVDVSVAAGFWWDDPALRARHGEYLLEVAERADGAIVPFIPGGEGCSGACGFGEVREADPERVPDGSMPVLVHCSEEVGHAYGGKAGGLTPGALWRLLEARPHARVIAAHWGGGFPFYALMPEVAEVIADGRVLFDTAASHYLYGPQVFSTAIDLLGAEAIAWGSDFPLRPQAVDLADVRAAIGDDEACSLILGENAARFLGLSR